MKKKLKIMQIVPRFDLAGAEIMAENLSIALSDMGFDVIVVSLFDFHSAITDRLEDKNIKVHYLGKKMGFDMSLIPKLYKLFKEYKPNVIHTHQYAIKYAMIAAILKGIKIRIHTIHNIAVKETGRMQRKANRILYKFFNVIPVSISPIVKDSIIAEYGLKSDSVPMIYNGVDLNKCIVKTDYKIENDRLTILHIGRFSEQKNHKLLIESLKIIKDTFPKAVLKLIGEGELSDGIVNMVNELNLEDNVEFLGIKKDVFTYLNDADIFVLPSAWEGMPMTLIEAMGTGLPIAATGVGGVPDMIENGVSGLLTGIDSREFADVVIKLINDDKLREKLGRKAKSEAAKFSLSNMAEEYLKLYENTSKS